MAAVTSQNDEHTVLMPEACQGVQLLHTESACTIGRCKVPEHNNNDAMIIRHFNLF